MQWTKGRDGRWRATCAAHCAAATIARDDKHADWLPRGVIRWRASVTHGDYYMAPKKYWVLAISVAHGRRLIERYLARKHDHLECCEYH